MTFILSSLTRENMVCKKLSKMTFLRFWLFWAYKVNFLSSLAQTMHQRLTAAKRRKYFAYQPFERTNFEIRFSRNPFFWTYHPFEATMAAFVSSLSLWTIVLSHDHIRLKFFQFSVRTKYTWDFNEKNSLFCFLSKIKSWKINYNLRR